MWYYILEKLREFIDMKRKFGFTLAETLIVLCVLGVLATIMLSSLTGMMPDKSKVFYKKAYQTTERVVGELVNDENLYPYNEERIGFRNTERQLWPGTNEAYEGNTKFANLFRRKVNTSQTQSTRRWEECLPADNTPFTNGIANRFITTDGICWGLRNADFTGDTSSTVISIDINGAEEPNTTENGPNRDRFRIFVDYDGRVHVDGPSYRALTGLAAPDTSQEVEYLQTVDVRQNRDDN